MVETCVVDSKGFYIKYIDVAELETFILEDGQSLVISEPPAMRPYTGYPGFVKPKWDGSKWVEGATFQELIAWEMTHPKSSNTEGKTIWDTLDDSYAEGVNTAYDQ